MHWGVLLAIALDMVLAALAIVKDGAGNYSPERWGFLMSMAFAVWALAPGLLRGEDGKPSISKLQFFLWTTAFAFAVGAFCALRLSPLSVTIEPDIPTSSYAAMGMATTLIGAKGITVHNVTSGLLKTKAGRGAPTSSNPLYFLADDAGQVQLTKVQLLFWTVVAIVAFHKTVLTTVDHVLPGAHVRLPDIDPMLISLLGIGQATYLGRKVLER